MRRGFKALIAMIALVAMLSENVYSVYAAMEGADAIETTQEAESVSVETVTEEVAETVTEEPVVEEASAELFEDSFESESDVTEETVEAEISKDASIIAEEYYLSFDGVDDCTLYINTDDMNDSDTFLLEYTEDANPDMDDVLFDTMQKSDGGIYYITNLNKEYFELWVSEISEGMEALYEIREDGNPQIRLSSAPEEEIEKILDIDGTEVYGEGYTELHISVNTEELADDAYYALHVDTDAAVVYDGEELSDNTIYSLSNETTEIYLSNLDNLPFTIYITAETQEEVGVEYEVESVENGALGMSVNMEGMPEEEEEKPTPITIKANIVDEDGNSLGEDYVDMELPKFTSGRLVLDDVDSAPYKDVEIVDEETGKTAVYTYVEARLEGRVITALVSEEIADENADEDEEAEETVTVYSYTEDGEEWIDITEDCSIDFVYAKSGETEYTYEDEFVKITVTLDDPSDLPDDAVLHADKVTSETDPETFENTGKQIESELPEGLELQSYCIYDVYFTVNDEETEPLNPVSVNMVYKQKELISEDSENEEIAIDEVKVYHFAEDENGVVTSIEDVSDGAVTDNDGDISEVNFTTDSFSPIVAAAVAGVETFEDNGGSYTLYYVLNNFDLFVKENVKTIHTVGSVIIGGDGKIGTMGNGSSMSQRVPNYIKGLADTGNVITDKYFYLGTVNRNNPKTNVQGTKGLKYTDSYVDFDTAFNAFYNQANSTSCDISISNSDIKNNKSFSHGKSEYNYWKKNTVTLDAGYSYVFESFDEVGIINIKGSQTSAADTVIKVNSSNAVDDFPWIYYNGNNGDSQENGSGCSLTFLLPNTKSIHMGSTSYIGHIVAPNADVKIDGGNYNGCIICNSLDSAAEGHMWPYNGSTFTPSVTGFTAVKTLDGKEPSKDEVFTFKLEELSGIKWKTREIVKNDGSAIAFSKIAYAKEDAGTHYYRISEEATDKNGIVIDSTTYIVKTVVVNEKVGNDTVQKVTETYYKGNSSCDCKSANAVSTMTFDNKTAKGELIISKELLPQSVAQSGTFYVTLQDSSKNYYDANGNNKGSDYTEIPVVVGTDTKVSNLLFDTYTVTEVKAQDANGNPYEIIYNYNGNTKTCTVQSQDQSYSLAFSQLTSGKKLVIQNKQLGQLSIKKVLLDSTGNATTSNNSFYVVVYSKGYKNIYYGTDGKEYSSVQPVKIEANSTTVFAPLSAGRIYYVYESDEKGNKLSTSETFAYNIAYSQEEVQITESDLTKEVTITNTEVEKGKVILNKKGGSAEEATAGLSGVRFQLFKEATNRTATIVKVSGSNGAYSYDQNGSITDLYTGTSGSISVENLPIGNYYFKEISLPDSKVAKYIKYEQNISFAVDKDGIKLTSSDEEHVTATADGFALDMTVYNKRVPFAVEVTKMVIPAVDGMDYTGFEFILHDVTAGTSQTVTTDPTGKAYFTEGLVFGHSYRVEEDAKAAAKLGYVLKNSDSQGFTVDNTWYDNASTGTVNSKSFLLQKVTFTNEPVTGKVRLLKQNSAGATITEGSAKFELYSANNNSKISVKLEGGSKYVYDLKGTTELETVNGELTVEGLVPGSYYFVETASPDANKYVFSNKIHHNFEINAENATTAVIECADVKVPNDDFGAQLVFDKVNAFDTAKKLGSSTVFTLYATETLGGAASGASIASAPATNGTVSVPFAAAGTYVLVEESTETGYVDKYDNDYLKIYLEVKSEYPEGTDMMNLTLDDVNAYTKQNGRTLTASELVDKTNNQVKNEPSYGKVTLKKRFLDKDGKEIVADSDEANAGYLGEASFTLYTNSVEFIKKNGSFMDSRNPEDAGFIEYGTYTTSSQTLTVDELPWGTYYFVETATVMDGETPVYDFDDAKYEFTIDENSATASVGVETFTKRLGTASESVSYVDNTIKYGDVKIVKQDEDSNKGISGIAFELHRAIPGESGAVLKEIKTVGSYTTDGNGEISVTGLTYGDYYFAESATQTVAGYEFDPNVKYWFKITGEGNATRTLTYYVTENGALTQKTSEGIITNTPMKGEVTLEKWAIVPGTSAEAEYLETLSGAKFELYYQNTTTVWQKIASIFKSEDSYYSYKADGSNGEFTTDANGQIYVKDLPWGSYYFLETEAPAGHKIDEANAKYNFTIDADHLEVHIGRENNDETSGKIPVNERYYGNIMLSKKNSENGEPISGVAFRLYEGSKDITAELKDTNTDDLKSYQFKDGTTAQLLVTDSEGEIKVDNLPWGTYVFVEAEAPAGYIADDSDMKSEPITIDAKTVSAEGTYQSVSMTNTPITGDLFLEKVNENGEALTGATFDLVYESRKDGQIAYKKVEVSGSNGTYSYLSSDSDYAGNILDKIQDVFANIFSGGAKGALETSASGTLKVTGLPYGTYQVIEITAPVGYEPKSGAEHIVYSFSIDGNNDESGNDASVTFENSLVNADVQFVKTVGNEQLSGVKFQLQKKNADGYYEDLIGQIATAESNTYYKPDDSSNTALGTFDGVVSFTGLSVGEYRVYEISSFNKDTTNGYPYLNNAGQEIWSTFDANTSFYTFEITEADQGKKNVGMIDYDGNALEGAYVQTINNKEREGYAKLLKVNSVDGAIEGATFALYKIDADGKETCVEQDIVSTSEGVVTKKFGWGNYYLVETNPKNSSYFLEKELKDRTQYHFTIGQNSDGSFTECITSFTAKKNGKIVEEDAIKAVNKEILGKAEFDKIDSYTGKKIKSAKVTFDLYYRPDTNTNWTEVIKYHGINAKNGTVATEQDLNVGEYYFVETSVADGYKELPDESEREHYQFTISAGETDDSYTITWDGQMATANKGVAQVENTPQPGSVTLLKYYKLPGDSKEYPLAGATFTLKGKDEKGESYTQDATSNAEGKVSFTNVPWGTYSVVEKELPAGYEKVEGQDLPTNIEIGAAKRDYDYTKDANLKIENARKPGKLLLKKVDAANHDKGLAGVSFELQKLVDGKWVKVPNSEDANGYYTTGEGGFLSFFNLRAKKGQVSIDQLDWGYYQVIERAVPEGYMLDETPIPTDGKGVYVGAEDMSDETALEVNLGLIENSNVHGNIALIKTDTEGNGLKGAQFRLDQKVGDTLQGRPVYVKQEGEGVYSYVTMDEAEAKDAVTILESPEGGKIRVTGLPCGTYYMQETKAPDPTTDQNGNSYIYTLDDRLIEFVVDTDATADEEAKDVTKTFINSSDGFKASVIFNKKDNHGTGLNGVKYIVSYGELTSEAVSANVNGINGVVKFDVKAIGTYTIKEQSVPDDAYVLDDTTYTFEIKAEDKNQTKELSDIISVPAGATGKFDSETNTFVNDEMPGSVILYKYESETGKDTNIDSTNRIGGLNGASFRLYRGGENGEPVANSDGSYIFTTATVDGVDGVIKVDNLAWGSYTFVETGIPEGYSANSTSYSFTIGRETYQSEQKIEIINAYNYRKPGSITLEKSFEGDFDDDNIFDVLFALKLEEGTADSVEQYYQEVSPKLVDGKYIVSYDNLPWGVYTLTEKSTAEGYILFAGSKTIQIGSAIKSEGYTKTTIDKQGIDVKLLGEDGIENEQIKGSVKLQKVNSITTAPMQVRFKLYQGAHPGSRGAEVTSGMNPVILDGTTDGNGIFTTDDNGYFEFPKESLPYGDYFLVEEVPAGYYVTETDVAQAPLKFTYQGVSFSIKDSTPVELTKSNNDSEIQNTPATGSVKIKKVDTNGNPIKGVSFTLYADDAQGANSTDLIKTALAKFLQGLKNGFKDGENGVIIFTAETNEKGELSVEGLPWGKYHFVENIKDGSGYTLSEAQKTKIETPFVIGANGENIVLDYSFIYENGTTPGSVTLVKYERDGDKADKLLAGAKFSLYQVQGERDSVPGTANSANDEADIEFKSGLITSAEEGDNYGKITVEGLPWGQYYFVETEPPFGYELDETPLKLMTVGRNYKTAQEDEEIGVSEWKYSDASEVVEETFLNPSVDAYNDKGYGYTALYKIFDLKGAEILNTAVENKGTYLTFELHKVGSDGTVDKTPVSAMYEGTETTEFRVYPDTMATRVIGPVEYGDYVFVEKSVPSDVDYEAATVPGPEFSIDGTWTREAVESELATLPAEGAAHSFAYVRDFTNTLYRGWAQISKQDADAEDTFVEGVTFNVYKASKSDDGNVTLTSLYTSVTTEGAAGIAKVANLPLGTYAFLEDADSAEALGYVPTDSAFVFTITEELAESGERAKVVEAKYNSGTDTYTIESDEEVTAVKNGRKTGSIKLIKSGKDGAKLEGAVFNLYRLNGIMDANPGTANGNDAPDDYIGQNTTDENGEIFVDELAWGTYYFDEVVPPMGYLLKSRPNHEPVAVGNGGVNSTVTIEMDNQPIEIAITKTDITGTKELGGAKMELSLADNSDVLMAWTSNGNEKSITIGSSNGKSGKFAGIQATTNAAEPVIYELKETAAPAGYTMTSSVYFSVDVYGDITLYQKNGGSYEVATLENAEVAVADGRGVERTIPLLKMKDIQTDIKITKRELGTDRYLAGATLAVYDQDNYNLYKAGQTATAIKTWTTAEADEGQVMKFIGELNASSESNPECYYLVETKAPAGFIKADPIGFYVTNSNEIKLISGDTSAEVSDTTLIMYDRPIYVLINKKASNGTTNLAGANLTVSDYKATSKTVNKTFDTTSKPTLLVPVSEAQASATDSSAAKYAKLSEQYSIIYDAAFELNVTYNLKENSAPEGYKLAGDQQFTINPESESYDKRLGIYSTTMLDHTIKIYISKKELTSKEELPGAKLQIYEKKESGEKGDLVTEWTSTSAPKLIGIDEEQQATLKRNTSYILVEDTAPLGYALTNELEFTIDENGKVVTSETVTEGTEIIPKITMSDEPLAIAVVKENTKGIKLTGATLELKDSKGTVIATWDTHGKPVYISDYSESKDSTYENVKPLEDKHLVAGEKYTIEETVVPTGYQKAATLTDVTAYKASESIEPEAIYHVIDTLGGETSLSGKKTWKINDTLRETLTSKDAKVKINLYRYYTTSTGGKCYVDKAGNPVTKKIQDGKYEQFDYKSAVIDTREISAVKTTEDYTFGNLDQYFYDEVDGTAHEYTYFVEEDLNGLEEDVISKQSGNDFVNYQSYTEIHGDKNWILFKDKSGNVVDVDSNDGLKAALGLSDSAVSAYADVKIYLARLVGTNRVATRIDDDNDGKADYSVTIRHGAKDTSEGDDVEIDDNTSDGKEHVTITWTEAGKVKFGFVNLPMYDTTTGEEILYAFVEEPVDDTYKDKYTVVYDNDENKHYGTDGVSITNEPVYDPFTISGKKIWMDPFDASTDERPEVTIQLYRDGVPMEGYRKTLTASDDYAFVFKNLFEYDLDTTHDGHQYEYEIREEGASGRYKVSVDFNGTIQRSISSGEPTWEVTVTNEILPEYISIRGTKTWNNRLGAASRPTVTFDLFATDSERNHELIDTYEMVNSGSSTYEFKNLPKYDKLGKLITYEVVEEELSGYLSDPVNGYKIVPSTTKGEIDYPGNDFTNTPSVIRIRKRDLSTGASLAGATLRVTDARGREVDRWISSMEDHYIEGLTFGETYILEEVAAPSGYEIAAPVSFTVNADTTEKIVTMDDPRIVGDVTLTKRDATTREALTGAVFNLYTSGGSIVHVTGDSGAYRYTTDTTATTSLPVNGAGTLYVSDLPYGTYYFREVTPPSGYTLSGVSEYFTIYETGAHVDVTFLNERALGAVSLRKAALGTTTTLAGATFELYSSTPRTPGQAAASTIYSDAYYRYGTYTTGADGMIYVGDLPWDSYYFIEVEAPTGYVTNTDVNGDPLVYTFTVGSTTASDIAISMGTITNGTGGGGEGGGGSGRRSGGVVSGVLGVRAAPKSGVLGARIGPVTGDAANIALWLLLLVASIAVIVVISIQNHKRKKERRQR